MGPGRPGEPVSPAGPGGPDEPGKPGGPMGPGGPLVPLYKIFHINTKTFFFGILEKLINSFNFHELVLPLTMPSLPGV